MTAIAIATRNAHKTREIQEILDGDLHFLNLLQFGNLPGVEEDAPTFAGNAAKKAQALAQWIANRPDADLESVLSRISSVYVLADDSGLEVDALGGAPGVHSARFAAIGTGQKGNSSDASNNAKLLDLLKDVPAEKRTARFRCVLAIIEARLTCAGHSSPSKELLEPLYLEGACEGRIAFAPSGTEGFGYDPLFVPEGQTRSFAELGGNVKNSLSHRAVALRKLRQFLLPGNRTASLNEISAAAADGWTSHRD
jgi:XTP/dITP diphosphohydrolase